MRFVAALLLVVAGLAQAQPVEDRWQFTTAVYGWLAGVDGTMAAFGAPAVDASSSFSDTLERFDGALMGLRRLGRPGGRRERKR